MVLRFSRAPTLKSTKKQLHVITTAGTYFFDLYKDLTLYRSACVSGRVGPHDVGLKDELDYFHRTNAAARQKPPIVTCKTIYSSSNFTVRA
jgi:hypothetical protein